ncbi:hypothetical protein ACQY0O_007828 [Thecaphora frezii]
MTAAAAASSSSASTRQAELELYHDFATSLAVEAGKLLCRSVAARATAGYVAPDANGAALDVRDKSSSVDVVTDTDIAVEKFIIDAIRARFPQHKILAEETYAQGGKQRFELGDEVTWIVDPLDGTVNYVHLFPLICVSIGLCIDQQPVVGAIYAPLLGGLDATASRGTLWSSCQGRGAYQSFPTPTDPQTTTLHHLETYALSRSAPAAPAPPPGLPRPLRLPLGPLRPLGASAPSGLLIASEWGKDRRDTPTSNLNRKANTFLNLASAVGGRGGKGAQVHGIRSLGSAALDLAYCAAGSVDVFWEGGCWEWDVCAGLALLYEAGGLATDANGPQGGGEGAGEVTRPCLGARRFLCIRPCADSPSSGEQGGETAQQAQERVARAVWRRLDQGGLDYRREGVVYPQ